MGSLYWQYKITTGDKAMRVKSLLVILITLILVLFVSACSAPDQQVDTDNASASTSVNQEQMPIADSTESTAPDAAPAQDSTADAPSPVAGSDKKGFPAPQPASANTVAAATQTWDDAEDVMRSGRVLSESPVYESPEASADVVGEHEAGELVIVTRSLDDWYEIIYNDGATRHAWLPQSSITFDALFVAVHEADAATTTESAADPTPATQSDTDVVEVQVVEIVAVSAPAKTAAPASIEQGVIVFQTSSGGSIYSMNADGSNLQLITAGGLDPALSPDGTQVAYARWDEPRGLFVVNIDGSDERWLVGENLVKNPAWSPDGEQIVFNVQSGGSEAYTIRTPRGERTFPADPHWRLQVIDATGENLEGIADNMHSWNPDWSEYGILYAAEDGIYVTSPDGSPHHIYDASNTVRNPAWSPDGQTIIATMEFHDHWEVVRINRDGTGLVRLDQNYDGVHSVAPAWSADGEQILYLSDRNGEWQLWVMDADGGNKHLLAPGTLSDLEFRYDFNAEQMADWR